MSACMWCFYCRTLLMQRVTFTNATLATGLVVTVPAVGYLSLVSQLALTYANFSLVVGPFLGAALSVTPTRLSVCLTTRRSLDSDYLEMDKSQGWNCQGKEVLGVEPPPPQFMSTYAYF